MGTRTAYTVTKTLAPARDFSAAGAVCVPVPAAMIPLILGALEPFAWEDAYAGEADAIRQASQQVQTFLVDLCTARCSAKSDGDKASHSCGGVVVLEGDEMGQVVTDVFLRNGKLVVQFGPCCEREYEFDADKNFGISNAPEDGGFEIPSYGPTESYTACAKAAALIDVHIAIADSLFDDAEKGSWPWEAYSNLRANVPGINFGMSQLIAAYGFSRGVDWQGLISEAEDPEFYQLLRCNLAQLFDDDSSGITETQYSQAIEAVRSAARSFFPLPDIVVAYKGVVDFHVAVMSSIGAGDANNITSFVADDGTQNCDCPSTSIYNLTPDANGWYFRKLPDVEVTMVSGANFWNGAGFTFYSEHDIFGMIFDSELTSPLTDIAMQSSSNIAGDDVAWQGGTPWAGTETSFNGNTSSAGFGNRQRIVHGVQSVFDSVIGAGLYNLYPNGQTFSSVPASPGAIFNGDKTFVYYTRVVPGQADAGTLKMKNLYVLHNSNSPSHGA